MTIVTFTFDEEKDIWNVHRMANKNASFTNSDKMLDPRIFEIAKGKTIDESRAAIRNYNQAIYASDEIPQFCQKLNQAWEPLEKPFFERLEKVMNRPLATQKIIGFVTTQKMCPYHFDPKESWFMTSICRSVNSEMTGAAHEIFHFQFHAYYWDSVAKEIGDEKTGHLKEALTVLINLDFSDLFSEVDRGYPIHFALREFITQEWKKEPSFKKLIQSCIQYLKENEIQKP